MREIHTEVLGYLSRIIIGIPEAIKKDLLFPRKLQSLEEQLFSRIRKLNFLIQSQQDRLSSQAGVIQGQSREIRDRDLLLIEKDKEIKKLTETNRSLEFQLQEASSRHKRKR